MCDQGMTCAIMVAVQEFLDTRTPALKALDELLERLGCADEDDLGDAQDYLGDAQDYPTWEVPVDSPPDVATPPKVGVTARARPPTAAVACRHEHDPRGALPALHQPSSYRRDAAGVWRYEWGGIVPGARDDTLSRRYRFGVAPGPVVRVPTHLLVREELQWVSQHSWDHPAVHTRWLGVTVGATVVERACWDLHCDIPLGILAPELSPVSLLDTDSVAVMFGLRPATVSSYRARGRFPAPQFMVSNSPLWSAPVVERWWRGRGKR